MFSFMFILPNLHLKTKMCDHEVLMSLNIYNGLMTSHHLENVTVKMKKELWKVSRI